MNKCALMFDNKDDNTQSSDEIKWLDRDDALIQLKSHIQLFLRDAEKWHQTDPKEAPPVLGMKVSAGLGKTRSTLESIAEQGAEILKHGHIFIYVPTLDLADQAAQDFKEFNSGLPHMVLRGRSAINPSTGAPMCSRADLADAIVGNVSSVTQALCRKAVSETETVYARCATGCAYLDQTKTEDHRIVFLAHAYLRLRVPLEGEVALRIIDEKFWGPLVHTETLYRDHWLTPQYRAPSKDEEIETDQAHFELSRKVRHAVSLALETGEPIHGNLRDLEVKKRKLQKLANYEAKQVPGLYLRPDWKDDTLRKKRDSFDAGLADRARVQAKIFRLLAATADQDTTERLSLARFSQDHPDRVTFKAHFLDDLPQTSPWLLLDADLDSTITRQFFPNAEIVTLHARPKADIIQVRNRTLSDTWLTYHEKAEHHQDLVLNIIKREVALAASSDNGRLLVVGTRKVLKALFERAGDKNGVASQDDPSIPSQLHGADVRWYGAKMLGINDYKEHATVILVGRMQLNVNALEDQLKAMFGDSGEPLVLTQDNRLVEEGAGSTASSESRERGSTRGPQVHPDERGTALLRQNREAASEQAIARLRLVFPNRAKRVVILSNVPLPNLPVDTYVELEAFAEGRHGHRRTSNYRKLESAVTSNDGAPSVKGLRTGKTGLFQDARHFFTKPSATKEITDELSNGGVTEALAQIASDRNWNATEVTLAPRRGGKPFSAVVFSSPDQALDIASELWPGFKVALGRALTSTISDQEDVIEDA